ncbi:PREDICTED: uncharacterized protein LOC105154798 isoform X2 [Acromyrmex echinatior]|nr:PREDICTED: uncharacterized protein LOC105154798 isoform X2 [Acromyrmex echinatior]
MGERGEAFRRRYDAIFRGIRRDFPTFWREAREVAEEYRCSGTGGAVVRKWPDTRDAAVQTGDGPLKTRDASQQTDPMPPTTPPPRRGGEERGTSPPQRRDGGQTGLAGYTVGGPAHPGGCWNCGRDTHRYSDCPYSRDHSFYYGCGRAGTTRKNCSRCKDEYDESEGPVLSRTLNVSNTIISHIHNKILSSNL